MAITDKSMEYASLREELMSLHERAHQVWRWGFVFYFGLLSTLLATLIALGGSDVTPLRESLMRAWRFWMPALHLVATLVACATLALFFSVIDGMNRLGGYLAVFHDLSGDDWARENRFGWHVWNRIEKVAPQAQIALTTLPLRIFHFHGNPLLYPLAHAVFALAFALTLSGATQLTRSETLILGVMAGAGLGVTFGFATRVDRSTRRKAMWWNARWRQLSGLDRQALEALLVSAQLRSGDPPGT